MKRSQIYSLEDYQISLNSFVSKCSENQIWFSLANKTLLSALTNVDYFDHDDYLEVFMTFAALQTLQEKYNEFLVSPNNNSHYAYSAVFFVEPQSPIVIKIILVVPAGIKKTEQFYKRKNRRRQAIGYWSSNQWTKNFWKHLYYQLWSIFQAALVWEEVYAKIYAEKYQGFFIIDDLRLNINQNWIPNLTFKTKKIPFFKIECPVIEEAEVFLTKRYGWNWQEQVEFKEKPIAFNWVKNLLN